jgi:hypothetical protein
MLADDLIMFKNLQEKDERYNYLSLQNYRAINVFKCKLFQLLSAHCNTLQTFTTPQRSSFN